MVVNAWLVNVNEVGAKVTAAEAEAVPVPDKLTLCGLPEALLAIDTEPVRAPATVGVKVTPKLQVAAAATVEQVLLTMAKSPAAVTPEIVKLAEPLLVTVIVWDVLVVATV